MNLKKIRLLGEMQDKIMDLTGEDTPLITFELEESGVEIHNPFYDVTGRFEVDPIKEYGEENLLILESKINKFEEKMKCKIENLDIEQFHAFLKKYFFTGCK